MTRRLGSPNAVGMLLASLGGVFALVGVYWDDAWHTDRGRDTFWSAPHLVLYAGVAATTLMLLAAVRRPSGQAQVLAVAGGAAVLASAPVDEAWHSAFGRDAVLWSPPHMFTVIASLALAVGVLGVARGTRGRAGAAARLLAAATVVGSLQVPVLEFDSDVPQFPTWTYLPVAVAGWIVAMVIVRRLVPARWSLTVVVAGYTALRIGIATFLDVLDHSGTIVPPLLALAVLDDILAQRGQGERVRLAAQAAVAPLVWFGWLEVAGSAGTMVPVGELLASLAITFIAASIVALLVGPRPPTMRAATVSCILLAIALLGLARAPRAAAHDPGQGEDMHPAMLEVRRTDNETVAVTLTVTGGRCDQLVARRTVARRAGDIRNGDLGADGTCRWRGQVRAPDDGRWFIYVELAERGRAIELWVPLAGEESVATLERPLYAPPTRPSRQLQSAAGMLLYAVLAGALIAITRASRRLAAPTI